MFNEEDLDMGKLRDTFDRVLNTVQEYAQLTTEVRNLRSEVNGVKQELDTMRHTNKWLDEQIVQLRQARDKAISELGLTQADNTALTGEISRLSATNENQSRELARLNELVMTLRKDRDNALTEATEWEEKHNKLHGKLTAIQQVFTAQGIPLVQDRNRAGQFEPKNHVSEGISGRGPTVAVSEEVKAEEPKPEAQHSEPAAVQHPEDEPKEQLYGTNPWWKQ